MAEVGVIDAAPVGVIGLGLMGSACARRLLAAGQAVLGYDVDPVRMRALVEAGAGRAGAAGSVAEIAARCEVALIAVFDTVQVCAVTEQAGGLALSRPAGRAPLTAICLSTCDPDEIAALAARLPEARIAFVEMPVSGTSDQVARGEALALLAGDTQAIAGARRVIETICPRGHVIGRPGDAGRAKLAVNLILGLNRAALAEGIAFAERLGLDPAAFLSVARDSAAYSQVMDVKGAKMVERDYAAHGRIAQSAKDFALMLALAARVGQQLPLAATYAALVEGCQAAGEGDWDNSAIVEELRRRRGAVG